MLPEIRKQPLDRGVVEAGNNAVMLLTYLVFTVSLPTEVNVEELLMIL